MTEAPPTPPTVFVVQMDYHEQLDIIGTFATLQLAQIGVFNHIVAVSDPKNGDTVPTELGEIRWEAYPHPVTNLPYIQCGWDDMEFQIEQWTVQQ